MALFAGAQFDAHVAVVSGLLISKSYEQSDSLRNYYRNRCLRIFPGLWVCLVASLGVILVCGVGSVGALPPSPRYVRRDARKRSASDMALVCGRRSGQVFLRETEEK
jgi:hypothetical protein